MPVHICSKLAHGLLALIVAPFVHASALTVKVDRADAHYPLGATATFRVRVTDADASVSVRWTMRRNGAGVIKQGESKLSSEGTTSLAGTLTAPGFLTLELIQMSDKPAAVTYASAAFEPEKLRPSLPVPADFGAFWAKQKQILAAIPVNVRLTPVAEENGIAIFDLQADCVGGVPVSGYLARPLNAAPRSLPAILVMQGAGVRSSGRADVKEWAQQGLLAVNINAHGLPNGRPDSYYDDLSKGALRYYWGIGRDDRGKSYFRGMFLRVLRAIDAIAKQPEWDGRTLIARGGSQGGAQAIVAGALDPRVTFVAASVPALADHSGFLVQRAVGWPQWVKFGAKGMPNKAQLEAARYYDTVNFATRALQPAYFSTGFIDRTCPPSSVYTLRNAWAGPVLGVFDDIEGGHRDSNAARQQMKAHILRHIAEQRVAEK